MTPADVIRLCCLGHGITLDALRGPGRGRYLSMARKSCVRSLSLLGLSSIEIGLLVNRDSSTVRYLLAQVPGTAPSATSPTRSRPS